MVPVPFTGPSGSGSESPGSPEIIYAPGQFYRLQSACGSFLSLAASANTDLFAFTIPGGTLSAEGDTLRFNICLKSVTAEAKTCKVFFNGDVQDFAVTVVNPEYYLQFDIFKESANARSRWRTLIARAITLSQSSMNLNTAVDWSTDQNCFLRLNTPTAGSIEVLAYTVDLIKAEV